MSVAALRTRGGTTFAARRLALAILAVALVGAALSLLLWWLAPATPPAPTRNPFGVGAREAAPSATGLGGQILAWQAAFHVQLRSALASLKQDGAALPALLAIGFAYGVFHAAGPGHGKAVVASYIVANESTLRRGLALSAAAAAVQALVAIALVGLVFALVGGTAAAMSRTTLAVEMAGFALVCAVGAVVVWRKAGALTAVLDPSGAGMSREDACAACLAARPTSSWREAAGVALAAGIRPCAGALVVLTLALSQGLLAAGIGAVAAMAAGTALTTGALAALAVYAKRVALAVASGRGRPAAIAAAAAELAAAAFVLVVGIALLSGTWAGGI